MIIMLHTGIETLSNIEDHNVAGSKLCQRHLIENRLKNVCIGIN